MANGDGHITGYIRQRIARNKNFICAVTGSTGSGKSYSALRLGELLDPNFDARNIVFSGTQLMALVNGKVKPLGRGSVIMFDEIQISLGAMDYQSLQAKLLNYLLSTFRHQGFILIVTTPFFSYINAAARKLFHCRMETLSINPQSKRIKLKPLLLQINQQTGDTYQKYLRVKSKDGFVPVTRLSLPLASQKLIDDYEAAKKVFTNSLNKSIEHQLNEAEGVEKKELTQKQEEVLEYLRQGKKPEEISEELGISFQSVYKHMELIGKKGIKLEPIKEGTSVLRYNVGSV